MNDATRQLIWSVRHISQALHCSREMVLRLMQSGEIRVVRVGDQDYGSAASVTRLIGRQKKREYRSIKRSLDRVRGARQPASLRSTQ